MIFTIFQYPRKVFILLFSSFILFSLWIYTIPFFRKDTKITKKELKSSANGRLVWQKYNCHTCHQLYGLGGYLGPDLTNVYSRAKKNETYIKAILSSGVRQMPAFDLSKEEMEELLVFLKDVDASGSADITAYTPEIIGTFSLRKNEK